MRPFSRAILISVAVVPGLAAAGCASATPPTIGVDAANRVIDARADEQVRRMADYLTGLARFRFEVDVSYDDFLVETQKVQFAKQAVVEVQRPDRCRAVVTGDRENRKHWYDGKQVVSLDVDKNCYAAFDVPDTIDRMLTAMAEQYDTVLPLSELVASNAYDWLMGNVITARYVGESKIGGVKCHHLAFEQATLNWQLWVEDGEQPFPRRLLIVYQGIEGLPQYEATIIRWDAAPTFREADFSASLPADAVKIDTTPPSAGGAGDAPTK